MSGAAGYPALASDDVATRLKAPVLVGFSDEATVREKLEEALQGG